jgi:hypothetical protein
MPTIDALPFSSGDIALTFLWPRPKYRYYEIVSCRLEGNRDAHPDVDPLRGDINQIRDHPNSLVKVDEHRSDRIVKRRMLRMMENREAVHLAVSRHLFPHQIQ